MNSRVLLVLFVVLAVSAVSPQSQEKAAAGKSGGGSVNEKPKAANETASDAAYRFDVANIDVSVDPCVDFYQYACGNWIKNNPLPADHSFWGSFAQIGDRNGTILRRLLEEASKNDPQRSPIRQKIGDYYATCMDEEAANKKGYTPIKSDLELIASIKDTRQMMETMAHLESHGAGSPFAFSSGPDLHQSTHSIAFIDQGGISLPDRGFYINDNASAAGIRQQFVDRMKKMFSMIGQNPEQAAQNAEAVLKVETELARASMDRMSRRDPKNRDHKMKLKEIEALAPNFHLDVYFKTMNTPPFEELNVSNPEFFTKMNPLMESIPLDSWKAYMVWHLLSTASEWLSEDFTQEHFKFTQMLMGQKEIPARWKRCVDAADSALGEALGQAYVDETFGAEGKQRALKMVGVLEAALRQDIIDSSWMSEPTKKEALVKLAAIRNKIGYPDKWRDYSKLEIVRGDLIGNFFRTTQFEIDRVVQKIETPIDNADWIMTPPTVNAYYTGNFNEIVFPAGILQPPFFDRNMDDAVNFGAIGAVIGHELTHGFDDQGRQFDAHGNLHDWWAPKDAQEFEKRADCFVQEYNAFPVVDDVKVNGKLTLGENIADNGGARIALMALHQLMAGTNQDPAKKIDGYTPDQRFFLAFGRSWCDVRTPEFSRMRNMMNPHPPGRWRTNGVVQNMPEFQKAFGCKPGQPMVKENACHVW